MAECSGQVGGRDAAAEPQKIRCQFFITSDGCEIESDQESEANKVSTIMISQKMLKALASTTGVLLFV